MALNFPSRNFNCKNEELPVICRFAAFSLKRDLNDFSTFSPKFNEEYVTLFENRIAEVSDLVEPKSETAQLKVITERLYASLSGLSNTLNRLSGYVTLAGSTLKISPSDFGIAALRKGANSKDVENVLKNLHLVLGNIERNRDMLEAQGLRQELVDSLSNTAASITADKQTQYEISINRKNMVQNNQGQLNSLYEMLNEILNIGKILYKNVDLVKQQEYTFNDLKKKVRRSQSASTDKTDEKETDTSGSAN